MHTILEWIHQLEQPLRDKLIKQATAEIKTETADSLQEAILSAVRFDKTVEKERFWNGVISLLDLDIRPTYRQLAHLSKHNRSRIFAKVDDIEDAHMKSDIEGALKGLEGGGVFCEKKLTKGQWSSFNKVVEKIACEHIVAAMRREIGTNPNIKRGGKIRTPREAVLSFNWSLSEEGFVFWGAVADAMLYKDNVIDYSQFVHLKV